MMFKGSYPEIEFQISCRRFYDTAFEHPLIAAAELGEAFETLWARTETEGEKAGMALQFADAVFHTVKRIGEESDADYIDMLSFSSGIMFNKLNRLAHDYAAASALPGFLKEQVDLLMKKADAETDQLAGIALFKAARDTADMVLALIGPRGIPSRERPQPEALPETPPPRPGLLGRKPRRFDV